MPTCSTTFSRTSTTKRRGGLKIRTPKKDVFRFDSLRLTSLLDLFFVVQRVDERVPQVCVCVRVCPGRATTRVSPWYPPSDPVRVLKQTRRLATTLLYRAYLSTSFVLVRRPLSLATTRVCITPPSCLLSTWPSLRFLPFLRTCIVPFSKRTEPRCTRTENIQNVSPCRWKPTSCSTDIFFELEFLTVWQIVRWFLFYSHL